MDRKGQLANVSFGGAWSEQIAGNEALTQAMCIIEASAQESAETDLRGDKAVQEALAKLAAAHPKGAILAAAWNKGLGISNVSLRTAELARIAAALRAGLGKRLEH